METVLKKESEILDEFLKNESPESITDGQWHHIKLAMVAYHEQFSPVPAPSISAKEKALLEKALNSLMGLLGPLSATMPEQMVDKIHEAVNTAHEIKTHLQSL